MLYTIQISVPTDIEKIDITAKSSYYPWDIFAPPWGSFSRLCLEFGGASKIVGNSSPTYTSLRGRGFLAESS